jgi:putative ABC transport system permease protein
MTAFALKGIFGRKLRTTLTAIAIVLGVVMISGTYVLTDSIDKAFDAIFGEIYKSTDATITGKTAFDVGGDSGAVAPPFDENLLTKVQALPDVKDAIGGVGGEAQLIGDNGKAIVFGGAPNLGFSVDPTKPQFNTLKLVSGKWPGRGEVVVDTSTASKKDLKVGEEIGVQAEGPVTQMRISGLVRFGAVESIGGATLAGFDLPTAQTLFGKEGKLDQIRAAAKPGVSPQKLVSQIRPILPPGTQVRTGTAQAREDASDTEEFISFLQKFLLAFAGIALFVGAFVIANSLSITIAQRTREFATLRTLGASRRQVLTSVVLEAFVVGTLASIVGLFVGLALAKGLFKLFDVVGFTLPNQGLIFETRTIVVALLVGIVVTVIASLRPAVRATRVPPIAAVREGATLPPSRFARFRTPASALTTALGFAALLYGLFRSGLGTTQVLLWLGVGALLVFIGVSLLSIRFIRPLAAAVSPIGKWTVVALSILVWPFWTFPYWLLRYAFFGPGQALRRALGGVLGLVLNPLLLLVVLLMWVRSKLTSWNPEWPVEFPGVRPDRAMTRLATENGRRNPQRTASTAAALMIGLALVTLISVLAAGIISSFRGAVNDIFTSDYAITAQNNYSPIPIAVAGAAANAPGVTAIGSVRTGETQVFGKADFATAVDQDADKVMSLEWDAGSNAVLNEKVLGPDGVFVDKDFAKDHDLKLGSKVPITFVNGIRKSFTVKGIFDPPAGGSPFGHATISAATWDEETPQPKNIFTFLEMAGGETDANQATLDQALSTFPNAKAQTRQEFIDN